LHGTTRVRRVLSLEFPRFLTVRYAVVDLGIQKPSFEYRENKARKRKEIAVNRAYNNKL